jgi:hypothetical protein
MSVDAKSRHASREAVCCFDPTTTAAEPVRTSRALCNVMLDVLGRDNTLRTTYVRRRWQGLEIEIPSDDQRRKRRDPYAAA